MSQSKVKKTTTAAKTPAAKAAAKKAGATKATPAKGASTPAKIGQHPMLAHFDTMQRLHLERVAKVCETMGFETSLVNSAKEAGELVLKQLLPASKAKTVGFGGSVSVLDSGIFDAVLADKTLTVFNSYDASIGAEAMIELRRQSLLVDFFITSVNAITEDGKLVLLDGIGNRTAAIQFGPKKVVLLVGRNKLCADIESAVERIKNVVAPANAIRLNRKTPCTTTGYCMDCKSPDRICSTWTITERSSPKGRIHIIFINDNVGY